MNHGEFIIEECYVPLDCLDALFFENYDCIKKYVSEKNFELTRKWIKGLEGNFIEYHLAGFHVTNDGGFFVPPDFMPENCINENIECLCAEVLAIYIKNHK